ncbi:MULTISPECIES: DUF3899 domain-containing protein [unclassified Geobacillus]|uniref:DUF3899 domain-containing protein n=1 Tax=unclassified Geobacillus TaxID=2642459 RepID=UPI00018C1A6B|nr:MULTISPECIES: DUF3899 domain-containing protein [unclassified Geobacillus]ADU94293.1 hypothetical protein GYMC52_1871 [Geobacillus sp. Y412MC52]AGE22482.1 hypothetical protein GHH_c19640 [Geobacillus sp. GHH01]
MTPYFMASFCTVIVLLCVKQFYDETSMLVFVNDCFLLGLVLLVAGAALFIYQTGFFRPFFEGFQRLYRWIVPKPKMLIREEEKLTNDIWLNDWKSRITTRIKTVLLGTGTGCLFISLTYLFFYYLNSNV